MTKYTTFNQTKNTNGYKLAVKFLTEGFVRPVVAYGKGKMTTYRDHTADILKFINKEAVEVGNDAPRGGATGKFLKIKE